jgi:hypothetical protein
MWNMPTSGAVWRALVRFAAHCQTRGWGLVVCGETDQCVRAMDRSHSNQVLGARARSEVAVHHLPPLPWRRSFSTACPLLIGAQLSYFACALANSLARCNAPSRALWPHVLDKQRAVGQLPESRGGDCARPVFHSGLSVGTDRRVDYSSENNSH